MKKRSKQKLDEVRTLAIKLFEAAEMEDIRQFPRTMRCWRQLPSESMAVWDAIAIAAIKHLKKP